MWFVVYSHGSNWHFPSVFVRSDISTTQYSKYFSIGFGGNIQSESLWFVLFLLLTWSRHFLRMIHDSLPETSFIMMRDISLNIRNHRAIRARAQSLGAICSQNVWEVFLWGCWEEVASLKNDPLMSSFCSRVQHIGKAVKECRKILAICNTLAFFKGSTLCFSI